MAGFPENVMDEISVSLEQWMPQSEMSDGTLEVVKAIRRPLRYTDPERSIGIHPVDWTPEQGTVQIGQPEPAVSRYLLRIQNLVKHTDEEEGRALYVTDAKMVRAILYRDAALRVRCGELSETILDTQERFKRMGVRSQRFLNNELSGQFVFLATTDLWVETEVTQL